MTSSIYVAIPLMALLAVVQTAVLPHFPIFGLMPQLTFLAALAWGFLRGVNEGVVWAFAAGFFVDLFSVSPLGLTAVSFMVATLVVTLVTQILPESRYLIPMIQAALATLIALLLYTIGLWLFGRPVIWVQLTTIPSQAVLHAILILPVFWLMERILRTLRPRRVEL